MKRCYVFVAWLISLSFFNFRVNGQSLPTVVNVTTPEVTAFKHEFEVPVSLYSGVPNISIPLYEIKMNGVTVPITLSYHAGGIRADQEATWVGLGWSLDYGGMISRKVKGAPDEDYFIRAANTANDIDHFNQLPLTYDNFSEDIRNRMDYIREAKYNSRDFMPDEFYYSALGYSGKCMFNQNQNKFVLFPHEDISIRQFKSGLTPLYSWNVLLPNGVSVDFGKDAYTAQNPNAKNVKSAWQIKTIRNLTKDSIVYEYDSFLYDTYALAGVSSTSYAALAGSPSVPPGQLPESNFPKMMNTDSRLRKITFPEGTIEFEVVDRADMPGKRLKNVIVRNKEGIILKKITLMTSYFIGNKFDRLPSFIASKLAADTYRSYRLKLDELHVFDAGNIAVQKYKFEYNDNGDLPSKYTYSQDHWGYYNGATNSNPSSFIPNIGFIGGGNRAVDTLYSSQFSLKSIQYPEGGKTRFTFEGNTAQTGGASKELLQQYQDKNIPSVMQVLTASGWSRRGYGTPPDATGGTGEVFYFKDFTVSPEALMPEGIGFEFWTNYGISELEKYTPYSADNVEVRMTRINSNGNDDLIVSYNTTEVNPNPDGTYKRNGTYNRALNLTPGTYRIQVRLLYLNNIGSPAENQPFNLWCYVRYRQPNPDKPEIYVGGLRVKTIQYLDTDGSVKKTKRFRYVTPNYPATPNLTSGRIVSLPSYFKRGYQTVYEGNFLKGANVSVTFSSSSVLPLETTSGSYAGYEYVDELDDDGLGTELKTSHRFSFNQPYFYNSSYPYMSLRAYEPQEWTNGKLLSKAFYKGVNVIRQEDYSYFDWSPHLSNLDQEEHVQEINTDLVSLAYLGTANAVTVPYDFYDGGPSMSTIFNPYYGQNSCITFTYGAGNSSYSAYIQGNGVLSTMCNPMSIQVPYFKHYTGFDKLKRKVTTDFEGLNKLVTEENYNYDKTPSLYQLSKTYSLNSRGDTLKTQYTYPGDSVSVAVYAKMANRHILTPVISRANYKNSQFLSSVHTIYKQWPADTSVLAPERELSKIGTAPASLKLKYLDYDNKGNILSASRGIGAKVSYLWGYDQKYPVAAIGNASLKDVYYESFEEWTGSGLSVLNDSKTGRYSRSGSFSKALSGLTPGRYTLVYWRKSGGVWSQVLTDNIQVTGSYTVSLSGQVDDIRFYPKEASVTTYTYEPLIGMTSMTDAKNDVTYYEYDSFNRLKNVRDTEGNIVKNYCYNYAGQEAGCPVPVGNQLQSQVFTRSNCTGGNAGSSYTYTVAANQYYATTQAEANQLALNDIAANGQNQANANGTCSIQPVTLVYTNHAQGASIVRIRFKDSAGNVIYNFTQAQLQAGRTIQPGIYNVEVTTSGGLYNSSTGQGWNSFDMNVNSSPVRYYYQDNLGSSTTIYNFTNFDARGSTQIYISLYPNWV